MGWEIMKVIRVKTCGRDNKDSMACPYVYELSQKLDRYFCHYPGQNLKRNSVDK